MVLSHDQFLPGMDRIQPAQPYEQTPEQFMNRPDVFVHGRYVGLDQMHPTTERHASRFDFHAGSRKAAHHRLSELGPPFPGYHERFLYGRVDPSQMSNTPARGDWEPSEGHLSPEDSRRADFVRESSGRIPDAGSSRGRVGDAVDEWSQVGQYYRNDFEDPGSTSVILGVDRDNEKWTTVTEPHLVYPDKTVTRRVGTHLPKNFETWRDGVRNALESGTEVPTHVRGIYEDTGGDAGFDSVVDTEFKRPVDSRSVAQVFPQSYGWR